MAVSNDVTLPDAVPSTRLHPYILTLVKWCASCLWGAAAILLRRLLELPPAVPPLPPLPLPPIAALVRSTLQLRARRRSARAPNPHISHAATVECEVLHTPPGGANVDVVFVHGLYGCLANTWRQGRWRSKHKADLNKIPLKRHSSTPETPCTCSRNHANFPQKRHKNDKTCLCEDDNVDRNRKHKAKDDNDDRFDRNTNNIAKNTDNDDMLDRNRKHNSKNDDNNSKIEDGVIRDKNRERIEQSDLEHSMNGCCSNDLEELKTDSEEELSGLENENYIISNVDIVENYTHFMEDIFTNDPMEQYRIDFDSGCDIDMIISSISGNGAKSCDNDESKDISFNDILDIDNEIEDDNINSQDDRYCKFCSEEFQNDMGDICKICNTKDKNREDTIEIQNHNNKTNESKVCQVGCGCVCSRCYSDCWPKDWLQVDYPDARIISVNYTSDPYLWRPIWIKESKRLRLHERAEQMAAQLLALGIGSRPIIWVGHSKGGLFIKHIYSEGYEEYMNGGCKPASGKSLLWSSTAGFMFYSVPHRGSPLADINIPPLVARSIELLEMGKDCSEVLALQARWLRAMDGACCGAAEDGGVGARAPTVRSLVETRRTLMAVLWLRIVSVESADAGIGALCGVSVDHREICKPSSRSCLLYQELLQVIDTALARTRRASPEEDSGHCGCHQ